MNAKEIEFKYPAQVPLSQFEEFCIGRPNLEKQFNISGYDHFYSSTKEPESFYRHRIGPKTNQLTFKRKHSQGNVVRTEHNLDLAENTSRKTVQFLVAESGYKYNTSIFKTCFIFVYDYYVLSYYTCYDANMNESGRFIEIEVREDYPWTTEQEALDSLLALERICKPLGLEKNKRETRSLFEMYRTNI